MDFPNNPALGTLYTYADRKWIFSDKGWDLVPAELADTGVPNLDASKITSGVFGVARGAVGLSALTAGSYLRAATTATYELRTPAQMLGDIGGLSATLFTGSEILSKLAPVSGEGSGLDADKLDGYQGSYFLDLTNAVNRAQFTQLPQIATGSFLGRIGAGLGNIEVLTGAQLKSELALDQVSNTSDANKPLSTAATTALNLKANVATRIIAGDGLSGGGTLGGDTTIALGLPTTITRLSTNSVSTGGHTHALSTAVFTNDLAAVGADALPTPGFWTDGSTQGAIKTYQNSGSDTGFPATMGATWTFRLLNDETSSTYGRTFDLHKTHGGPDTTSIFLRTYNSSTGAPGSWHKILTDGNTNLSLYATTANMQTALDGKLGVNATAVAATTAASADTAVKLTTARTLSITGPLTGSGSFDGTANVAIALTVANDLALPGNPTTTTQAVGTNSTRLATTAFTVAEIGSRAPTKAGVGATGTWGIAITGNAATATLAASATKLATARTINGVAFDGTANITITSTPRASLGAQCLTITDWNNATDNGWYMAHNATNAPHSSWSLGLVLVHNGDWIQQEVYDFTDGANVKRWRRHLRNGAWDAWTDAMTYGRLDVDRAVTANSAPYKDVGHASAFFARGAAYTRLGGLALLWNDAPIWQIGAESNGDYKLWSYSDTGVYTGNPMTVKGDGRVGINEQPGSDHLSALNVGGGIRSRGGAATLGFTARDDGRMFDWYAVGHRAHLHADGVGDILSIGTGKEINATTLHMNGGDANPIRMINGQYGAFFRQDGADLYLMFTNPGDQYGGWSGLRPMRWSLATGNVFTDHRFDAAGGLFGGRVATGYDSGEGGSVNASNWFRSLGDTGWHSASYGGGVHCTDATYVRAYNGFQMAASDFVISSDRRLKYDVKPLTWRGRLTPVSFKMYSGNGEADFGFIADWVEKLYPEAIGWIKQIGGKFDGEMVRQLSYQKLTAVLSLQINRVEDDVIALKQEVKSLKTQVSEMEARQAKLEEELMWLQYS